MNSNVPFQIGCKKDNENSIHYLFNPSDQSIYEIDKNKIDEFDRKETETRSGKIIDRIENMNIRIYLVVSRLIINMINRSGLSVGKILMIAGVELIIDIIALVLLIKFDAKRFGELVKIGKKTDLSKQQIIDLLKEEEKDQLSFYVFVLVVIILGVETDKRLYQAGNIASLINCSSTIALIATMFASSSFFKVHKLKKEIKHTYNS